MTLAQKPPNAERNAIGVATGAEQVAVGRVTNGNTRYRATVHTQYKDEYNDEYKRWYNHETLQSLTNHHSEEGVQLPSHKHSRSRFQICFP